MMQHVVFVYGINLMFAKGLVADLTAEQMCQQPHGVVNHPAWSLGHLAYLKGLAAEGSGPRRVAAGGLGRGLGRSGRHPE